MLQAWYLGYGTKDVFESVCHKLNERIAVELDGKAIELPELEGIVLLNIASWSSGCDLWAGSGLEELPGPQRLVLPDCVSARDYLILVRHVIRLYRNNEVALN